MTDEDHSAAKTDWLAHTIDGYGYGYTKKQALLAVAPYIDDRDKTKVEFIEHAGDARTGLFGWEVDTFVSGERITLDRENVAALREAANRSQNLAERVLDTAGRVEIDPGHDHPEPER